MISIGGDGSGLRGTEVVHQCELDLNEVTKYVCECLREAEDLKAEALDLLEHLPIKYSGHLRQVSAEGINRDECKQCIREALRIVREERAAQEKV